MEFGICPVCGGSTSGQSLFCSQPCAAAAGVMSEITEDMILDTLGWIVATPFAWRERLDLLTILSLLTLVVVSKTDPMVLILPVALVGASLLAAYAFVCRAERHFRYRILAGLRDDYAATNGSKG